MVETVACFDDRFIPNMGSMLILLQSRLNGYLEITLTSLWDSTRSCLKKTRIENHLSSMMEDALHFIKRIQALPNRDQLYIKFLCMLNKFQKSEMSSSEVYQEEHENLLENFKHFLHPSVKAPLQQDASSRINSSEVHFSQDGRSCTLCMTQSEQIEKREATISCHANQCLIADHDCSPNLDKALMKAGKGQREHVEKKILKKGCKRTVHLSDDEYLEHYNKKRRNLTKKQKFAQSINDSVSEKLHQECLWEEGCFASQRVNERECSDMHYTFCCKSYTDHNVPLSTEERSVKAERLQNLSSQIITIVILTIPVTAIFRRSVLYLR